MIVIYSPRASNGAKDLAAWLTEHGAKTLKVKGNNYLQYGPQLVIAWGHRLPTPFRHTLNGQAPVGNKQVELQKMRAAGVPTPAVSLQPRPGWWARLQHHHSGNDLLKKLPRGDYYVQPVPTTHEFRVHVWKGEAFRTGTKVPNRPQHHNIIRTQLSGWGLTYDRDALQATRIDRTPVRQAAIQAVKALGYDFGAVDIGYSHDYGPVVFEVNSAPGLEGVTTQRYGERILDHLKGLR